MPAAAQTMHDRHTVCKTLTRTLTTHARRLTALLLALLLCLTVSGLVGHQFAIDDNDGNVQATSGANDTRGSSRLDLDSERNDLLLRPNGHGGTVRVMVAIVSTDVTPLSCYAVASAYFADLPVVVVGYGEQYSHLLKFKFVFEVASYARLEDCDVVLALDSDVMFSGQDMLPYIDRFIAQSAASPRELDAKAVREGRAMAPSVFSAEKNCFWPHVFIEDKLCAQKYCKLDQKLVMYAAKRNNTFQPRLNPPDNPLRHINSGTSIHRMWSLRRLQSAIVSYIAVSKKDSRRSSVVSDDQSIIHALYHDLLEWEMAQNVYCNATAAKVPTQYGLPAGLIAVDWSGQLAAPVSYDQHSVCELTSARWDGDTCDTLPMYNEMVLHYVKELYAATRDTVHFTHRPFTRTFSHVLSTDVAPPLLSTKPYHTAGSNDTPAARIFPYLLHYCGGRKLPKVQFSMQYMPWYLPMMFDQDQWEKGRDYLLSMPMELWNATARVRVRYADVCPQHPFSVRPPWD